MEVWSLNRPSEWIICEYGSGLEKLDII